MVKKETAEAAEKTAEEKPAKPPKEDVRLWIGSKAAREGTTYNEFQKVVHAHPGSTEEALKTLIPTTWKAPNSEKFNRSPGQFIQGYLTAGVRKGYFVTAHEHAHHEVPVSSEADKPAKDPKDIKATRAGLGLMEVIAACPSDGDGFVNREVIDNALGKPMAQLGKGVIKLEKDGMIELKEEGTDDAKTHHVRLTDSGRAALEAAKAPAE